MELHVCCDGSLSHPPEFSVRAPFERSCRMRVAAKTLISSAPPAGSKQVFKDVDSQRRGAPFRPAQRRARSHFHDVAAPSPTASGSEGARARSRTMWAPHGEAIHLPPLGNIIAGRARARAPFLGSGRLLDCLCLFEPPCEGHGVHKQVLVHKTTLESVYLPGHQDSGMGGRH